MQINRAALTALRERSGMSKSELAERAGVDRTLVTRIESGDRRATPAVMKKFADALQVSVVALMGPTDGEAA
jgi:transcriptional regulator with XRE-family HTH domain